MAGEWPGTAGGELVGLFEARLGEGKQEGPMASWEPTESVSVPSSQQAWEALTFVHLPYEPEVIAELLPEPLVPDLFDGMAWVGVTPFRLRTSVLPVASGPRATYVEVNVRTYVRRPDGLDGIWFLSLELDQAAVAAGLRAALGLPYRWSDTWIDDDGTDVTYGARRRAPHRAGELEMAVTVGHPITAPGQFETFLVGRWRAFTERAGRLLCVPVEHEPWPLAAAVLTGWRSEGFLESLGVPRTDHEPHVMFADRVDVRLGMPSS